MDSFVKSYQFIFGWRTSQSLSLMHSMQLCIIYLYFSYLFIVCRLTRWNDASAERRTPFRSARNNTRQLEKERERERMVCSVGQPNAECIRHRLHRTRKLIFRLSKIARMMQTKLEH